MLNAPRSGNIKSNAPDFGDIMFGAPGITALEPGILKFKDPKSAGPISSGPFEAIKVCDQQSALFFIDPTNIFQILMVLVLLKSHAERFFVSCM